MDILTPEEQDEKIASSKIAGSYNEEIDRESAYEMLKAKIASAEQPVQQAESQTKPSYPDIKYPDIKVPKNTTIPKPTTSDAGKTLKKIANSGVAKTIFREVTRGLLGVLLGKKSGKKSIF